jgi:hypothetical protein
MALLRPRRAAGALALAAIAAACGDFVRPPDFVPGDPDQLLVHAVLHAGSDSAAVWVLRVGEGFVGTPVRGAQVRLSGSAGEAVLREVPQGSAPCVAVPVFPDQFEGVPGGCYVARVPGGVRSGAEYQLDVQLATGERARGRTVVPLPPALQGPAEGLRVPARRIEYDGGLIAWEPLDVRWTAPRPVTLGASAGRAWFSPPAAVPCYAFLYRPEGGEPPVFTAEDLRADSASVTPGAGSCRTDTQTQSIAPDSVEVAVAVTVYDSAYYTYVAEWNNGIPAPDASAGLEGAYGVFGSAATATRRLRLVPRP